MWLRNVLKASSFPQRLFEALIKFFFRCSASRLVVARLREFYKTYIKEISSNSFKNCFYLFSDQSDFSDVVEQTGRSDVGLHVGVGLRRLQGDRPGHTCPVALVWPAVRRSPEGQVVRAAV